MGQNPSKNLDNKVMKKIFLLFFCFITSIFSIHWLADRFSDTSDQELPATIIFKNQSTGWIGIYTRKDTVFKTTDGGLNWIGYSTGDTNGVTSLNFINLNTGWAVGKRGVIKKTSNGGLNWTVQNAGTTQTLNQVFFADSLNGMIVGGYEISRIILKTTNGGSNWFNVNSGGTTRLFSIYMLNTQNIYAVGDSGTIIYSSNAGSSWVNQVSNVNSILRKIKFKSGSYSQGYIVGKNGVVLTSSNGGSSWINRSFNTNNFYSLEVTSIDTAYISGQYGRIYKTTNTGMNWIQQLTPLDTTSVIKDINFVNSQFGWALNFHGPTIYTTNAGNPIGVHPISNEIPSGYLLEQNYPNPFNPSTKIQFSILKHSITKLTIYDVTGRVLAILVNEELIPGKYEVGWDASHRASGVYYYTLESEGFTETKKMVVLK